MYKKATRIKLRFDTKAGNLSIEDLWDLPLTSAKGVSLDGIAKELNRAIRNSEEEESFVDTAATNKGIELLRLKFDLVKDIIKDRLEERDARAAAAKAKEQRMLLMDIIAKKENEALEGESIEDLKKRLEALS